MSKPKPYPREDFDDDLLTALERGIAVGILQGTRERLRVALSRSVAAAGLKL